MIDNSYEYIELVRKDDNKQVYSSPAYMCYDGYDICNIKNRLNFYFKRLNDAIMQQLESPRLSDEDKSKLKLLDKCDYVVRSTYCMPLGCNVKIVNWEKNAAEFLD